MDVKNTGVIREEEESGASIKVDVRKKSGKPKKNDAMSQQYYIPSKVLQARQTPQGEPLVREYGKVRAERMSCRYCDRPPFRTKIGLEVHMVDVHDIGSDGEPDEDEGEIDAVSSKMMSLSVNKVLKVDKIDPNNN